MFYLAYGDYRGRRELKPFMRYVEARMKEHSREKAYRIYVTKSLQLAPQQKYLQKDYLDLNKVKKEPEKSGDEIVVDIVSKAGLSFG